MKAEEIATLLKSEPFKPFSLIMDDVRSFKVEKPGQLLLTRSKAVIAVDISNGVADHVEHCALTEISSVV